MKFRRSMMVLAATTAAVLLPQMAEAQRAGVVEVGALGRYSVIDSDVGIENALGWGGRLGIFFLQNLSLEVDYGYSEPELTDKPGWGGRNFISHELIQGRLLYNYPLSDGVRLLLGAGYTYDNYSRPRLVAARGGGPAGLLGVRFNLTESFSARVEGTGYYISADDTRPVYPRAQAMNLGLQAGISYLVGNRVERDVVQLPAPAPDTIVIREAMEPALPEGTAQTICLATGENVTIYLTAQGDTLVGPRRVSVRELGPGVAFAGDYAQGVDWFVNDEPVDFENRQYRKAGGEVGLDCANVRQVGTFRGIPLFADANAQSPFNRLYVPVRPGAWQSYETDLARVRGN
jgi:hypothetical protein